MKIVVYNIIILMNQIYQGLKRQVMDAVLFDVTWDALIFNC